MTPTPAHSDELRLRIRRMGGDSGQSATPVDAQALGHEADNLSAESAPEEQL